MKISALSIIIASKLGKTKYNRMSNKPSHDNRHQPALSA
jgi:hypothetical protein